MNMVTKQESAIFQADEGSQKPILYKAYEFAKSALGEGYVKVREYRTYFYLDGRVSHEVVLMETPFEQIVSAFDGVFGKSGSRLTAQFAAPERAKECARKIDHLYGESVEISGNRISLGA